MFFRKKKDKGEDFYEAVRKKRWSKVVSLGKEIFNREESRIPLDVAVSTARALEMLKKKDEAVSFLMKVARAKTRKGLSEDAEYLLQKALELKKNEEVLEEVINYYLTKGNREKAVEIISEFVSEVEEKGDISLYPVLERIVKKVDDCSLLTKVSILYESVDVDKAYRFWIETAECFEHKGVDEYAFRSLVRARMIKDTEEIRKRIVDFIAVKSGKFPVNVLIDIIKSTKNTSFWIWIFEEFKNKGKLEIFKGILEREDIPSVVKFFFTVLVLADLKGAFPEDILDEINKTDPDVYHDLIDYLERHYGEKLVKVLFGSTEIKIDDILAFDTEKNSIEKSKIKESEDIGSLNIEVDIDELFG